MDKFFPGYLTILVKWFTPNTLGQDLRFAMDQLVVINRS